jgi:hypothetical protein
MRQEQYYTGWCNHEPAYAIELSPCTVEICACYVHNWKAAGALVGVAAAHVISMNSHISSEVLEVPHSFVCYSIRSCNQIFFGSWEVHRLLEQLCLMQRLSKTSCVELDSLL